MTSNTPPPLLIFEIFNEIGIIEQLARAQLEAHLPKGLIAPHFGVLNHLIRRGDGETPIDLARAFQVPKTTMTHTIKGLVQHALVEVRANPKDGRSKLVWLTDKGRSVVGTTIVSLGPELATVAQGIDMDKLVMLKPVLTELRVFLDAARD